MLKNFIVFEADGKPQGQPVDGNTSPEESTEDTTTEEPKNDGPTFSQEDVDRIVSERLKREKAQAEEKAQKAAKAAADKALEEQQEFKQLAESRAADLEQANTQIETQQATIEATQTELDEYKNTVLSIIEEQRKSLPDGVSTLLDKLSPLEQMAWLNENSTQLTPKSSVPSSPKPSFQKSDVNEQLATEQRRFIRSKF